MSFAAQLTACLLATASLACASTPNGRTDTAAGEAADTMEKTLTFQPGRVYEVTGIWVKEGKADEIGAYFGEVLPIAAEHYGVKPLFGLTPISAYAGGFVPHIMFVNEWPSLEHFQRFVKDPRATALFPRRDAAVSRLVVTQYQVPRQTSITLRTGDVVEFAAMWIKPGQEDALGGYYKKAFSVAERHGIQPITPLAPVFSYSGDFSPSRAGLNLWGRHAQFRAFAEEAAPLFPERDAALDRLEVTHARVTFDGER